MADVSYAQWQEVWRQMIDVNLLGAAHLTYCVARNLISRGVPGTVVNIGSRGAFRGEPDFPAYGASKAALHAFGGRAPSSGVADHAKNSQVTTVDHEACDLVACQPATLARKGHAPLTGWPQWVDPKHDRLHHDEGRDPFGQSMAVALAPHGIAVASVAPGFVATERQTDRLSGSSGSELRGQSPFGRVGTPEEVAAAVLYLASPSAAWASGAVLDLNGASYLRT